MDSTFDRAFQLHQSGRLAEAERLYRQALALDPNLADAQISLAALLFQMGRLEDAVAASRRALTLRPNSFEACNTLGISLSSLGRHEEALAAYSQALTIQPGNATVYYNAAASLKILNKRDQAAAALRRALELKPDFVEAMINLSYILLENGQLEDAVMLLKRALGIRPDSAEALNTLGKSLKDLGRIDEALNTLQRAVTVHPDFPKAHNTLGNLLLLMGRLQESLDSYRRAVELDPKNATAHSNLVFAMNFDPRFEASAILYEARQWNERHAKPLAHLIRPHDNNRDPDRRLRIGYVSADFHEHPVSRFLYQLFENHDHRQYEIVCYCDVRRPDRATDHLRTCADAWHEIVGLPDARVAELIRLHGVDILVDLTGHTGDNRLLALARKPAPIQMTYLGYPATTGLSTIDYRLTDPLADPPGLTDAFCTETLLRLPRTNWCFAVPANAPEVALSPVSEGRPICFGSFNRVSKIAPPTFDLWSATLAAVPNSRLLIKDRAMEDGSIRDRIRQNFIRRGIDPARLELIGYHKGAAEHFRSFGQVDIALDTFPYHGTTTTCDALWMGVPVVTLAGQTHVSRVGVSLLTNIGLPELVAQSADEYIRIAAGLARNFSKLQELRHTLRQRMLASPLMDGPQFARDVEAAYRDAWRRWCAKK